ncbi:MAG TPA: GH25 family lysozyme [Bacteroidales bacterium]|nr:GH25 family lysozyme [Bacteroidales bacterium]
MARRRRSRKTKGKGKSLFYVFVALIVFIAAGLIYLKFFAKVTAPVAVENPYKGDNSFQSYVTHFSKYTVFGIDVSEYQKNIDWKKVAAEKGMKFVFIRATAGKDRVDRNFVTNWYAAGRNDLIRGAYHYYRPDENSAVQAENFIKTVSLLPGDLPPVLDIEAYSRVQNTSSLKTGLLNWLETVEKHYGVTPILYTFPSMYKSLFRNDVRFNKYTVWISYLRITGDAADVAPEWKFWQFSHGGIVNGINSKVDVDVFNGKTEDLEKLVIK